MTTQSLTSQGPSMFFRKKNLELKDKAVEDRLKKINKTSSKASREAIDATRKVNAALTREDIAFNLYYATHSRGGK